MCAQVLYCLIMVKLSVSSLLSQSSASNGIRTRSDLEDVSFRVLIGLIAALVSLPATVALDQLFWKSQRITNQRKMHDSQSTEVQLIARAALHSTFTSLGTSKVLMNWRMAVEEIKVNELRQQLLQSRIGRLSLRQQNAIYSKARAEMDKIVQRFERAGLSPNQFTSLVAALARKHVQDRWTRKQAKEEAQNSARRQEAEAQRALESQHRMQEMEVEAAGRQYLTPIIDTPRSRADDDDEAHTEPSEVLTPDAEVMDEAVPPGHEHDDADDDEPFELTVEALLTEAALRVQRAWRGLRERKNLQRHVSAAKLIASRWRRQQADIEALAEMDVAIHQAVVHLQQAFMMHRDERELNAAHRARELSKARPRMPGLKGSLRRKGRSKVVPIEGSDGETAEPKEPQAVQVPVPAKEQPIRVTLKWKLTYGPPPPSASLAVPAQVTAPWSFDPHNWFSKTRPMEDGPLLVSASRPSSSQEGFNNDTGKAERHDGRRVGAAGVLPDSLHVRPLSLLGEFVTSVEPDSRDADEKLSVAKYGGFHEGYMPYISPRDGCRHAGSSMSSRASSVGSSKRTSVVLSQPARESSSSRASLRRERSELRPGLLVSSAGKFMNAAIEARSRRLKLLNKRQGNPGTLAARAHVLAHRAARDARWEGSRRFIDATDPLMASSASEGTLIIAPDATLTEPQSPSEPLLHQSFLDLSSIEHFFLTWRLFAFPDPDEKAGTVQLAWEGQASSIHDAPASHERVQELRREIATLRIQLDGAQLNKMAMVSKVLSSQLEAAEAALSKEQEALSREEQLEAEAAQSAIMASPRGGAALLEYKDFVQEQHRQFPLPRLSEQRRSREHADADGRPRSASSRGSSRSSARSSDRSSDFSSDWDETRESHSESREGGGTMCRKESRLGGRLGSRAMSRESLSRRQSALDRVLRIITPMRTKASITPQPAIRARAQIDGHSGEELAVVVSEPIKTPRKEIASKGEEHVLEPNELSPLSAKARKGMQPSKRVLVECGSNAQSHRPGSGYTHGGLARGNSCELNLPRPDSAFGCGNFVEWREARTNMMTHERSSTTPPILTLDMKRAMTAGLHPAKHKNVLNYQHVRQVKARLATAAPCRCWSAMCRSVLFWRIFPWCFVAILVTICHLQVLFVATRIFSEYPNPVEIGNVWVQAIFLSFAIGWFIQDPIVIGVRNNLKSTKKIIRSRKYQVIEKFVVAPFRVVMHKTLNLTVGRLSRLLG